MDKKDTKKQLMMLSVILMFVIILAIVINVSLNKKDQSKQNTNTIANTVTNIDGSQTETKDVKINGYTKKQIEGMKALMDTSVYQKYMETFNAIESGSIPYQEDFKLDVGNLSDTTTTDSNSNNVENSQGNTTDDQISQADENGNYHYLTLNGEQTDIKVYDDVQGD